MGLRITVGTSRDAGAPTVEPHGQARGTIKRPPAWGDIPPTRTSRHDRRDRRPWPWPDGGVEDLRTLYRSSTVLIQGAEDVAAWHGSRKGAQTFLKGEILGERDPSGLRMHAVTPSASLADAILQSGPEQWRARYEGRYILVTVDDGGTCLLGTDRFGQMDLYIQEVDGQAILATDLSLLPLADGSVAYDQIALAHSLCVYGFRPAKQHTFYQGVRRLGVDQWIRIAKGRVEVKASRFEPARVGAYGERELEHYADLLLDAVRIRGSERGNVISLSSGWDSTALLACLVKLFGPRNVRAVTGRMLYADRSGVVNQFEIDRARAMAEYFGVRLDLVDFDYRTQVRELVERCRPLLRAHQCPSNTALSFSKLAEFIARTTPGGEAVFIGEISDGAHNLGFSQFVTIFHPVLEFREYSDKMASYCFGPTALGLLQDGQFADDPIYQLLRSRCGNALFDEPAADPVARRRQILASFFLRSTRLPFWSLRNNRLLTDAGREAYREEMERMYLEQAVEALTPETLYAWYLHLYNSFHWQSSTVAPKAVIAESHGLRPRLPFWDSRLQEFLSAMPESWGRGLEMKPTKYPLKWMLQHRLDYPLHLQTGPHSYLYDVNPGFSHGAELLYGSAFAPYHKELLVRRDYHRVLASEVFDLGYIDGMVDRYLAGTEVRGAEMNDLWALCQLSLAGWYGCSQRRAQEDVLVPS